MAGVEIKNIASTKRTVGYTSTGKSMLTSEKSLAHRFLRQPDKRVEKIHYEFTRDPGLLHQYYRLREEMFISVWGLNHFDGQKDAFDDACHIMVARSGRQCIAGGRLCVSSPDIDQALPMEKDGFKVRELFPELRLQGRVYGEFSRLAILPEFRAGSVFPEISRHFIKKAIALGVEYAFNVAPLALARNYRKVMQTYGLKWELRHDIAIAEREEYEGIKMVLSVMDLTMYRQPDVPTRAPLKKRLLIDS